MKLEYIGHACFCCVANDGERLLMDPPEENYGYHVPDWKFDYVTISHEHGDHSANKFKQLEVLFEGDSDRLRVGSFQLSRKRCYHDDVKGELRGLNWVYKVEADGNTFVHLGDLGHWPDTELTKFAANADVLAVPAGGFFTLNPKQIIQVIEKLNPKYAVPMHYRTPQSSLQQLASLDDFINIWQGAVLQTGETEFLFSETLPATGKPVLLLMDYVSRIKEK